MTDRVPGAPGQYQALVTAGALTKMQSGEAFPIILTRDDQPITEGTPYSKAAVLPDALAQKLCPGNPDPTPADALAALLPATHAADKDNPHGVTPAQIGAVSKTGDTMSGDLNIQKGIPAVRLDSGTGTAALFKNAAGSNDFGTTLEDVRTDGRKVSLSLNADQSGAEALSFYSSADNASYKVLHTGSKDKILSMTGGYSGAIYADPNGGTTSFNLPDVTETRNYLGIIRGLNPAYTAVYAFCGYQNSHYWAVPIKEHQYIGVSAQNGNTVTVTNNTGHSALYVRMIDMSII